jgi:hypothetical protein
VLCEAFAQFAGEGRLQDFGKCLFCDVAECNLSAMVETAGNNATVMENGNVRV